MIATARDLRPDQPALTRLAALAPLEADTAATLQVLIERARLVAKRRELMSEGRPIVEPQLIVSGWAARLRLLIDGRRQFLGFVLPGDIIGLSRHPRPIAASTVIALTDVTMCTPPRIGIFPELDEAYSVGQALDEGYAFAQITRLGRLDAQDRISDLLLELHERLSLNGMAVGGAFDLPLTQEILADTLGLTTVHVNRMLQMAKQNGDLTWTAGRIGLNNPSLLARKVGRSPVKVFGNRLV